MNTFYCCVGRVPQPAFIKQRLNQLPMKNHIIGAIGFFFITYATAKGYQPPEITIQHMSTTFANHGMCSVRFSLETTMGDGDAGTVTLDLGFLDKQMKEVARGQLVADLNDSTAGRYQEVYVEGEDMCLDPDTTVVVRRARSENQGKKFDLLKLKKIRGSMFRPYPVTFGR